MISNEIIIAVISAVSGGGIAGLLALLQRRRLIHSQADKIEAEIENIAIKTLTEALGVLRRDYQALAIEAENLKKEIDKLKREQRKLHRAIEKIQDCTGSDNCPVTIELKKDVNHKQHDNHE